MLNWWSVQTDAGPGRSTGIKERWLGWPWLMLVVGCSYALTAQVSLAHMSPAASVALFWPAAGLAAGLLIAMGRDVRIPIAVAVAIATVAANLTMRSNLAATLVFACCNAFECLLVAWLVERYDPDRQRFEGLRGVVVFIAAAIAAPALAAVPAALALKLLGLSQAPLVTLWLIWLRSDVIGIVTVAPLFVMLPSLWREPLPAAKIFEGLCAVALSGIVAAITLGLRSDDTTWPLLAPTTALFPLLLWLACRMRPAFSAITAFVFALVLTWTLMRGVGRLGDGTIPIADRVLAGQLAMLAVSICALTLAATLTHLGNVAQSLRDSEDRLRLGLNAGSVYAFQLDLVNRRVHRFGGLIDRLGLPAVDSLDDHLERQQPEVRAQFEQNLQSLSKDNPQTTFRLWLRATDGGSLLTVHRSEARFDADGNVTHIVGTCADITQRHLAEQRQARLIEELNHRVKNSLARVIAILESTRKGHPAIGDYVEVVSSRVHALARIHERLSANKWDGVSLKVLVGDELDMHRRSPDTAIEGPDVLLAADAAQGIALTVHELATNAAKYGALSRPGGRLAVTWQLMEQPPGMQLRRLPLPGNADRRVLRLKWREETDWDIVTTPVEGFGVTTIRNLLRYELGADMALEFTTRGVRCTAVIPFEQLSDRHPDADLSPVPAEAKRGA